MVQYFLAWLLLEPYPHLLCPTLLHIHLIPLSSPQLQECLSPAASKPTAPVKLYVTFLPDPNCFRELIPFHIWSSAHKVSMRVRSMFGWPSYGPPGQNMVLAGKCHKPVWGTAAGAQSSQWEAEIRGRAEGWSLCKHLCWNSVLKTQMRRGLEGFQPY